MNKHYFKIMTVLVLVFLPFWLGLGAIGVKQLSRNNLNEETLLNIILCQTTKEDVIKLFRKPTEDFIERQGDYTIYIYKGFSSRAAINRSKLEILLNPQDVVVDFRLNYEGDEPMTDQCLQ